MASQIGLAAAGAHQRFFEPNFVHRNIALLTKSQAIIYANCENSNRQGRKTVDGGASRVFDNRAATKKDDGCAFILDEDGVCGAARRAGSPYCAHHHAVCYVAGGSRREQRRLRETEALAAAVGGRRGQPSRVPPDRFLRRMENVARGFSRPNCSCIEPRR
jgi:hypothetical protein